MQSMRCRLKFCCSAIVSEFNSLIIGLSSEHVFKELSYEIYYFYLPQQYFFGSF